MIYLIVSILLIFKSECEQAHILSLPNFHINANQRLNCSLMHDIALYGLGLSYNMNLDDYVTVTDLAFDNYKKVIVLHADNIEAADNPVISRMLRESPHLWLPASHTCVTDTPVSAVQQALCAYETSGKRVIHTNVTNNIPELLSVSDLLILQSHSGASHTQARAEDRLAPSSTPELLSLLVTACSNRCYIYTVQTLHSVSSLPCASLSADSTPIFSRDEHDERLLLRSKRSQQQMEDLNISTGIDPNFPVFFSTILFLSLFLIFCVLVSVHLLANITPGRDSVIYGALNMSKKVN